MNAAQADPLITPGSVPDVHVVEAEVSRDNAPAFAAALEALETNPAAPLTLDLHGLDVDDGTAAAVIVAGLRGLSRRVAWLVLVGCPQVLAHSFYRVGDLESTGRIELVEVREDEPYG